MWIEDYRRIEHALHFLQQHHLEQPSLEEIAASLKLSKYHFHRLFSRWAGISPHRFLQYLNLAHAKAGLASNQSLLDATYDAGLSSPGRLHDLFVTFEAVTPGEFKRGGSALLIEYGVHPSPFGECLLALTGRGICGLAFVPPGGRMAALQDLQRAWPHAALQENPARTAPVAARIFPGPGGGTGSPLHLVLHGTNFQIKVWEALLHVPPGRVTTYGELAGRIGRAGAARAVGQAVARNPVAYLIPCHRVIRAMGVVGGYRWGAERKRIMLAWEAARAGSDQRGSAVG
jgi:AraC family transcriptional regulator of adaptative response/methylated-DNA-[protein]-cysteine methyltransferase